MTDFDLIFTHLRAIAPYMLDKAVTEINVNWDGGIYVERLGESRRAPVVLNQTDLQHGVQLIAHSVKGSRSIRAILASMDRCPTVPE